MNDANLSDSVRTLRLDLYGHVWDNEYALAKELTHITAFLRRLSHLQTFSLSIPHPYMFAFETTFESAARTLPLKFDSLTALCIEYRMVFLLAYCPQLKRLALYNNDEDDHTRLYQLNLAQYTICAPRITHLEAHALWTSAEIESLASIFPSVRHLAIAGYNGRPALSILADALGRGFKQLQVLVLPNIGRLDMGFTYHRLTHAWPGDEVYLNQYLGEKRRAKHRAFGTVFGACRSLEECWLGENSVARPLRRNGDGAEWELVQDGFLERECRLLNMSGITSC
jgi:hypothetical protein